MHVCDIIGMLDVDFCKKDDNAVEKAKDDIKDWALSVTDRKETALSQKAKQKYCELETFGWKGEGLGSFYISCERLVRVFQQEARCEWVGLSEVDKL